MFDLNDKAIEAEGKESNFDPSKIFGYTQIVKDDTIIDTVENVILSGIELGALENGTNYCDFNWTDGNANVYRMREFEVDPNFGNPAKKLESQLKRFKHIVTKYLPEGSSLPAANTFVELATAVKATLAQANANTKPMRLKMIYNDKGYLTTPKYVPFVESTTVPKADTKLKLTDFDQLDRPKKDTGAAVDAAADTGDDGLPF